MKGLRSICIAEIASGEPDGQQRKQSKGELATRKSRLEKLRILRFNISNCLEILLGALLH